jgi:hypothetical protein
MLWTAPPPAREGHGCGRGQGSRDSEGLPMQTVTTSDATSWRSLTSQFCK